MYITVVISISVTNYIFDFARDEKEDVLQPVSIFTKVGLNLTPKFTK